MADSCKFFTRFTFKLNIPISSADKNQGHTVIQIVGDKDKIMFDRRESL